MITVVITLIINIIGTILGFIFNLVLSIFPDMNLTQLNQTFTGFFSLIGNAIQLTYFIFGPLTFLFADIIITLWALKRIVLPIINFMRKAIIK